VDVLSDMLSLVRLQSTVFAQAQLKAPWGIRAEGRDHFAFHIISRGQAQLHVEGLSPVTVQAGDVVVLAPGRAHSLRDRPGTPVRDLREMLTAGEFTRPARPGGVEPPATETHLICGCFRFEDKPGSWLLSALPVMIHTREMASVVSPWLAQTIDLLAYEASEDRPGTSIVVNRLCDALFVYILRTHLAGLPASASHGLKALVDPQIGAALLLIHGDPAAAWTVGALATGVGMSRSTFAARFTTLVGETPMRYLSTWRLHRAAAQLRSASVSVAEVAAGAGYDSIAAFSKAFKRCIGTPPGTYRRTALHR
jgi:AraC-like DNA-binding protein